MKGNINDECFGVLLGIIICTILIGIVVAMISLGHKFGQNDGAAEISALCDRHGGFTIKEDGKEYTYKCELVR